MNGNDFYQLLIMDLGGEDYVITGLSLDFNTPELFKIVIINIHMYDNITLLEVSPPKSSIGAACTALSLPQKVVLCPQKGESLVVCTALFHWSVS